MSSSVEQKGTLVERSEENRVQTLTPTMHDPIMAQDAAQGVLDSAAERERTLLRSALEAMPVAFYVKDTDARRTFVNAAALALLGQSEMADVVGRTDLDLLPGAFGDDSYQEDLEALRTGQPVLRREQEYVGNDGERRQVLLTKIPLRDDNERIIGLAGMVEDITEVKALQAEFWQQQKMKSFAMMSSSVAHDFSNLLTPIIGLSEVLLTDTANGSRQQQFLDKILASAYKAKALLKQLRMFSRLHETQMQPVDFLATVMEVCNMLQASLPSTILLHTTYAVPAAIIQADSAQLFQAIFNLLVNAQQAIGDEVGEIFVVVDQVADVGEQAEPRQWLRLKISDTGQGIDEIASRDIFEPFSGARRGIGGALGLAIVSGVVRNLGGVIRVDSEPGHGSTFTILLPLPTAPAQ